MSLDKTQAFDAAKQYVLQRNVQAAVDIYQKLIQDDPNDVTASTNLGELFASTGHVREAIVQFSRVADRYIELGFARQAIATLKKIIAIDPGNTTTATKLADLYAHAGLPSEARQHYLQIADVLDRQGATVEALSVFSKIVELDPSNTTTRIKLGELYLREGMNEQAYDAFMTAAAQLTNAGEHRRALNAYNEALAIRPDSRDALAAARKLMGLLGLPPDKVLRNTGSLPDVTNAPAPDKSPQPAPFDSSNAANEPGSDSFVVQEISKAEILVAYGKVNQAITMLRQVLDGRPDNIDVHIKLKDIYLRNGMMVEAARECVALERIHETRGESERARDYAVRASRLTHLIEQPSGDLQKPARKITEEAGRRLSSAPLDPALRRDSGPRPARPEPGSAERVPVRPSGPLAADGPTKPVAPLPPPPPMRVSVVPSGPQAVDVPRKPAADPRPPALPMRVSVAPSSQATVTPPKPAPERRPPVHMERAENLPAAADTKLAISPAQASALVPVTQPLDAPPQRGLQTLSFDTPKPGRLRAMGIAAGAFVLLGVSAVIGGFAYNSHLDNEYASLSLAAPQVTLPPTPAAEEIVTEEASQGEPITLVVTPPSDTADQRPARERDATRETATTERPVSVPPATAPAKAVAQSTPLPPSAVASPDVRAGNDPRTPAGVPGEVPSGPTQAAEPPPKVIRQSPGVVMGGAIQKVDPVYPIQAKQTRQSGAVAVEVTISEQGNVVSARALTGPPLLRSAAVAAARGWRFKASTLGGVPVQTTTTIVFNFRL